MNQQTLAPVRQTATLALFTSLALGQTSGQAAAVPAALAGEWSSGYISPVEYYDLASGKWADASGTSTLLRIRADGTYQETGLLSVTTYGCTSKLFVQQEGTVKVQGTQVTFTPKTSRAVGYMCSPSKTYEKRNHVVASSYTWSIASGNKPVLTLTSAKGGSTGYDRR